jgi:hypothetical protein
MTWWIVLAAVLVAVALLVARSAAAVEAEEHALRHELEGVDAVAARAVALRARLEDLRAEAHVRRQRLARPVGSPAPQDAPG